MASAEILQKVKTALRRGDQPEIARRTGFSKPWVNQILNGKRGTENEENQKMVIDVALEIIEKRKNDQKAGDKIRLNKIKTLLA